MIVTLNIGLWINGKPNANLGPRTVLHEVITCLSPIIIESKQRFAKSGEPTMVITMVCNNDMNALKHGIYSLCSLLSQDCIALTVDSLSGLEGFLIGPNTAPYGGKFNPDYFIAY